MMMMMIMMMMRGRRRRRRSMAKNIKQLRSSDLYQAFQCYSYHKITLVTVPVISSHRRRCRRKLS
jgi:hypothetical protein